MKIERIKLSVISMKLKTPFTTHLGTVHEREGIVIEVMDREGVSGFGEVVAFSSPWYTEETVQTSLHMLKEFFIPLIFDSTIEHPSEVTPLFNRFRRNFMAKAGLEMAVWDLYAKERNQSLSSLLGGTQSAIPSGVVVGAKSMRETLLQIERNLENGYKRVKVKISPKNDYEYIQSIRTHFPHVQLMADANSAYTLRDINRLKALDEFGLLMIEQPLGYDDIVEHAKLQSVLQTPICLDESIVTFDDAKKAIELGSCRVINIKAGRVGGIQTVKDIHDYCLEKGVPVWCGGVLEFGISRAHNIAIATLPNFTIAGDISASNRYWEEDITTPEVMVRNGMIDVPSGPGIGFEMNHKRLKDVMIFEQTFTK
ncbi:o-succinylbenzoate synthase [Robertmurraya korlensis]|uniref:o-succinylbenzoate synthase n=1 Tax=Robertmurraya korlensis TaxID=519977 RepID=UPI00203CE275|nr:o-succinylbenzoate synthase [Robertmurraya korlensis]MCM3599130.1 o-succinylbenzoate synthase [Robertmurraya korlensis]